MIAAISTQTITDKLAAYPCPTVAPLPNNSPFLSESTTADFVKEIGERADAGTVGKSTADLQALIGALVAQFGNDNENLNKSAESSQARSKIEISARGAGEASRSLQFTGHRSDQIERDIRSLESDNTSQNGNHHIAQAEGHESDAEYEVGLAEAQSDQAERKMDRARDFSSSAQHQREGCGAENFDARLVLSSAQGFLQKAAARDAAARLRRALAQVAVEKAQERLSQEQSQAEQSQPANASNEVKVAVQNKDVETLNRLKVDREFMERLLVLGDELIGG